MKLLKSITAVITAATAASCLLCGCTASAGDPKSDNFYSDCERLFEMDSLAEVSLDV